MSYIYDKSGQKLFFTRETTYGKPYDPEGELTAFTITPAAYPHWRRFDKIPEGFDLPPPRIEPIKTYDVDDFKHAGAILEGNVEPVDFTISMTAQGLEFLLLACGSPTLTSHDRKITQTLTFDTAQPTQGDYFFFDCIESDVVKHYLLWSDTANDDTTGKPSSITGINASNIKSVDTSGPPATTTILADRVQAELEGLAGVTTAVNAANIITVVPANAGAVIQAREGPSGKEFGMTANVTTYGSTQYTMAEANDTSVCSFTIHAEQRNTTTAEDIVWEYFGCVIDSIDVKVSFENKIITYDVNFKCPYALENTNGRCTNPPPRKNIPVFGAMEAVKESADNYLLQSESTTTNQHDDRTPQTVDEFTLRIANNITFRGDVSKQYKNKAIAGKRDIQLQILGATQEKELFTYWQGAYDTRGNDYKPTSADGRLNSVIKLQKDATYDYILMTVRGWLLAEHNFHFMSVDEAVKIVDMTLEDGVRDSNNRILGTSTMISLIDETVMIA